MKPTFPPSTDRRNFLKTAEPLPPPPHLSRHPAHTDPQHALPPLPANARTQHAMPTRNLGKTGYKVGIFSLGGQAAVEKPNNFDNAVPIIERASISASITSTPPLSTAAPSAGASSTSAASWPTAATKAFLATKTKERTREGSLRMIEKSLKLLNTDHVDLWQLHDIGLPRT